MAGGIDASIPLGVKTPDTMSTIGSIVGIAKGATELQRSKVALEQDTGALDARKALAQVAQDPANQNEDGTLNLDKFSIAALRADPKNYLATDYIAKAAQANHQMVNLKSAAVGLGDTVQNYLGQRGGALALDPALKKQDIEAMLTDAERIAGPAAGAVKTYADIVRAKLKEMPDDPKALSAGLVKLRNLSAPVAAQLPQTALVSNGAGTVPVQGNAMSPGVGQPIGPATQNQIGAAGAEQLGGTDVVGNPIKVLTAPDGRKTVVAAAPGGPKPLLAFPPGEDAATGEVLRKERNASNTLAASVPDQRAFNREIIRLVDSGTITGSGADKVNSILTSAGLQGLSGNKGTDYNLLGHYISLQTVNLARGAGANTDASRELQEQATASRTWTPEAIKAATKVNDALAAAAALRNQGMEKAITAPENDRDIFALRDFKNDWAKNFDVNAARLMNAAETRDAKEMAAIVNEVGGKNSPGAIKLAEKMKALRELVTKGRLPQ